MPRSNNSTRKRRHSLSSPASLPPDSSSPDPPNHIAPSFGPLSDAHPSIRGMMKTNALNVIKAEICAFCTAHAPPKPARGPPHKQGHDENRSLKLCFGFGKEQGDAGRWFALCETCKNQSSYIQFKTPPLDYGVFYGLEYFFRIKDEIEKYAPPSSFSSLAKRPKKRSRVAAPSGDPLPSVVGAPPELPNNSAPTPAEATLPRYSTLIYL
ncbi:hypothetical protein BJ912DRAFT_930364 [Pholiota molesta]|nr:hypothetical protein BJ912DRAFT_930364 [Pholiota molesta]